MGYIVQGMDSCIDKYINTITNCSDAVQEYQTSRSKTSTSGFEIKTLEPGIQRAVDLHQPDAALGRVVQNRVLTKPGVPIKRHIGNYILTIIEILFDFNYWTEFELPDGMTSRAGDYLAM